MARFPASLQHIPYFRLLGTPIFTFFFVKSCSPPASYVILFCKAFFFFAHLARGPPGFCLWFKFLVKPKANNPSPSWEHLPFHFRGTRTLRFPTVCNRKKKQKQQSTKTYIPPVPRRPWSSSSPFFFCFSQHLLEPRGCWDPLFCFILA